MIRLALIPAGLILAAAVALAGNETSMPGQDIPRPEHPRPDIMREKWLNLNGNWGFEMDPGASGEARELFKGETSFSRTILVPFCMESKLSGIGYTDFMPAVWYKRTFVVPADWAGSRVILHFGASDYETTVWVNSNRAGTHKGGYSSFSFDITDLLKPGDNLLVVKAQDELRTVQLPSGKQSRDYHSAGCMYTRTTGIWQTVWLEAVPTTCIRSFRCTPNIDQKKLIIQARLNGSAHGMRLAATASAEGKVAGKAESSADAPILTLELPDMRLWEPGKPFLYDLELALTSDGKPVDRVKSYFGMRNIAIDGQKVRINGRSVFQRLVLDQGFYPNGIYTAPSEDALRRDIEISMGLGFNGARLHQKVFEPRFLYLADKLGYMVWGEYPSWGLALNGPQDLERVMSEWQEVLERDCNHPAIVGWCPFNETNPSQNPELLRLVYRATKQFDPTRPVIDASGYVHVETDIQDSHNYEQDPAKLAAYYADFAKSGKIHNNYHGDADAPYRGQPYFVSEYGGRHWRPDFDTSTPEARKKLKDEQADYAAYYKALTEVLLFHQSMFAFCFTQLYDVEQEVNGIYTYDRRPKLDPDSIRRINMQQAAIEKE